MSAAGEAALRGGPVAITGASGQVGRALQHHLGALANDVRPLGRGDDLVAAFRGAAAVVHLAGTLQPKRPNTYRAANIDTVAATVRAPEGSGVERAVDVMLHDAVPTQDVRATAHRFGVRLHSIEEVWRA